MQTFHHQVTGSDTASDFLKAHDKLVAEGKQVHRVAEFFAGPAVWSLRKDMERLVDTGKFSKRLVQEIVAYRMCLTDETCVEAVHRDISREGARVHYRTFPIIASQLRLKQNLQDIADSGQHYKELVEMSFAKVTSIVRREPNSRERGRSVRGMSIKDLCDVVYLCGRQKFVHFGLFEDKLNAFLAIGKQHAELAKWTRLRVDHLVAITKERSVCSLAEVTDEALQAVAKMDGHCEDAVALFERSTQRVTFFQVMQLNLRMKKFSKERKATLRDMSMPAQLQFLDIVSDCGDRVVVRPEGQPEIVDLVDLAPWPVFRLAFRKWNIGSAVVPGTLALTGSSLLTAATAIEDLKSVSALACLESLFSAGWALSASQQPEVHTSDSPRAFFVDDPVRAKAYLMCLVALPELLKTHGDGVPSKKQAGFYMNLLNIGVDAEDKALEDAAGTQGAIEESRAPLVAIEDGAARGVKRKRQSSAPQNKKKETTKKDIQAKNDEDILRELSIALVGGPKVSEGLVEVTPPPSLLDKGQCDRTEQPAPPAATDTQTHSQAASSGDAMNVECIECGPANWVLPLELEGVKVTFEKHNREQVYQRIMVKCPQKLHHRCFKKRNIGGPQTCNFGPIEPYAYLGLWLRKGQTDDCFEHKNKFEPDKEKLEAYIKEVFPGYIVEPTET